MVDEDSGFEEFIGFEEFVDFEEFTGFAEFVGFEKFVDGNDGNQLPNRSSGSFMTAILDIDGLLAALNFEEEGPDGEELYSQEEWDEAVNYWRANVQKLNNPKYD